MCFIRGADPPVSSESLVNMAKQDFKDVVLIGWKFAYIAFERCGWVGDLGGRRLKQDIPGRKGKGKLQCLKMGLGALGTKVNLSFQDGFVLKKFCWVNIFTEDFVKVKINAISPTILSGPKPAVNL
jgi:hypothetical protein